MARVFTILSAISVLLIVLVGFGVHFFSLPDIRQAKQDTVNAQAKAIALTINTQFNILQQTLAGIAQMPEVLKVLKQGNAHELKKTAAKLQPLLPFALKLRILPRDIKELDQTSTPQMGFADLEMVQATLNQQTAPLIQGQGENRHLALTALVSDHQQPIGVLLASLKYDFLNRIIKQSNINEGRIEIVQQQTVLASTGNADAKSDDIQKIRIPNTAWEIHYWPTHNIGSSELTLIISTTALCGLFACLAFFIGYRKLDEYLNQDQHSIIKVTKDLMTGKIAGNYPVRLPEMKAVISTLVQYKRVLDQQDEEIDTNDELDDFFDEPLDTSILDAKPIPDKPTETVAIVPEEIERLTDIPLAKTLDPAPKPPPSPVKAKASQDSIFKEYDIRGIVDKTLTATTMRDIGRALASEAKEQQVKTIVVGRDGRLSSDSMAKALIDGVVSTGLDVLDIGLIPTPILYFVAYHIEGRSGAMITGSHNPPDYNGVKMMLKGEALSGKRIQTLKQRIESGNYATDTKGSVEQNTLFSNEYIGTISEDIHIVRPMKVVLDCGNGAAGKLAPMLLKTIGCEVVELFCDIDGSFPNHHPDPSQPANLSDLISAVTQHQADIGIALDGDGDRLGVVDSSGKIIWPDRQMMLFAKDVLSIKPAAEVIFDVKCSRHLGDQITKYGGRPLMWKTGHSLMKAKLKQTGAALAGEMSGHIFFNDRWFGFDDGLYAAARMIEILSADTRPSSEVFADLPDSVNTPELTVPMEEGENQRFVEKILSSADFPNGDVLNIDGMRVDFEDGWGLIRASNTTPSLVLRFEADNQQALQRIQKQFKRQMLKIKSDLSLPF